MSESEINAIIASNINKHLNSLGKSQIDLAAYMEVSQATVSNWCKGIKMPRMDKIDRICEFLHCRRSDLMEEKNDTSGYYLDEETAKLAQEMFEDKDMRSLFDMKRNMPPERFKAHMEFMKSLYNQEKGTDL